MTVDLAGLLGGIGVLIGAVTMAARKGWPVLRKVVRLIDELAGSEDRPGAIKRLETMEKAVTEVRGELSLNSGSSVKDQTGRIERALIDHLEAFGHFVVNTDKRLGDIKQHVTSNDERLADLDGRVGELEKGTAQ